MPIRENTGSRFFLALAVPFPSYVGPLHDITKTVSAHDHLKLSRKNVAHHTAISPQTASTIPSRSSLVRDVFVCAIR